MKRLSWLGSVVFAVMWLAPATAQDSVPAAAKPESEKKVCRAKEIPTGSIMQSRRICLTKKEWTTFDETNRRNTETALDARRIINLPTD